jgi:hypothetical protein
MANTELRPVEAKNLQHGDVVIVEDEGGGEKILEIVGFGPKSPHREEPLFTARAALAPRASAISTVPIHRD